MITRRIVSWLGILPAAGFLLTGCGSLSSLPYIPEHTPESWLSIQPYRAIQAGGFEFLLMQPSSSLFVYLLGLLGVVAGIRIWRTPTSQRTRRWWGLALLLWGAGALVAGTSYQAFSFHIKCAGRAVCSWTSWWEIAYLLLSAASVNAMVVAGAYHGLDGKLRRAGIGYAAGNQVVYTVLVLVGAWLLDRFLISFEFLLLAAAPSVIALFFLNLWRYRRYRDLADVHLIKTWLGLGTVLAGYFIYLVFGVTDSLWEQGFWFSENDLLHIGLIGWMLFIVVRVVHRLHDLEYLPPYTP
jgi:hypothetical protein